MPQSATPRGRQHRKTACDECRRRKLRCDGQEPQCGVCQGSDIVCEVTQRGVRGPKKGYIKALRSRVVHLEAMLESSLSTQQPSQSQSDSMENSSSAFQTQPGAIVDTPATNCVQTWLPEVGAQIPLPNEALPDLDLDLGSLSGWPLNSALPLLVNPDMQITNAMHAELDQLYFDRVHPSIPILHQRRYLSWSKSSPKTQSRICLQYAMWVLATLLSAQFRDQTEPLYRETKRMLESQSTRDSRYDSSKTELVQAWLLVSICESMRTHHEEAWMSAGRVFRLVQAMRFHELDRPGDKNNTSVSSESDGFVETEEKRRVFWLAFFLDHLLSMRDDWPITLNEHVICTRLPAPDAEFQGGQRVLGCFLSEAMTEPSIRVRSPFNECLILATISGRNLLREQQYNKSKAYGDTTTDWEGQCRRLNSILTTRLQVLSQCYPAPTEAYDPLLLFANILGQTTVVYYCKSMMKLVEAGPETLEYQDRAIEATAAVIRLAKSLTELHFSKIHPLMPIPLFLIAEFIYDNRAGHESFVLQLKDLVDIFRELKNVNNYDQSYMDLLPASCIPKSIELLNHTDGALLG